ncbi:MAG: DUF1697 domain-containing protein [Phycisphaerales bacterium]|nr:DUF1697 domain-containing protein [Phycisphaerales bacterium]MCB9857985.1 DUF1697 domain-containing protein [Phycisphaerales bacterium]
MANQKHIALLRGINVGGKNKLPMAELRAIFESLGCTQVGTYIQSGNVVFEANAALAKQVAGKVSEQIQKRHSLSVPVVVRSAAELLKAVAAHPLAKKGMPDTSLFVMFLADKPKAADVKGLDPDRSPGDSYVVAGREIFVHCGNGAAKTKLTNVYFDRSLKTISTTRNWRTCQKLGEMVA